MFSQSSDLVQLRSQEERRHACASGQVNHATIMHARPGHACTVQCCVLHDAKQLQRVDRRGVHSLFDKFSVNESKLSKSLIFQMSNSRNGPATGWYAHMLSRRARTLGILESACTCPAPASPPTHSVQWPFCTLVTTTCNS